MPGKSEPKVKRTLGHRLTLVGVVTVVRIAEADLPTR
jgi:hypothetical protein